MRWGPDHESAFDYPEISVVGEYGSAEALHAFHTLWMKEISLTVLAGQQAADALNLAAHQYAETDTRAAADIGGR